MKSRDLVSSDASEWSSRLTRRLSTANHRADQERQAAALAMKVQLMSDEYNGLRSELQILKKCQIDYFKIAVSRTGIILSVAGGLAMIVESYPLAYLIPLVVILSCHAYRLETDRAEL